MLEKYLPFLNPAQKQNQEASKQDDGFNIHIDNLVSPEDVSESSTKKFYLFSISILFIFLALVVANSILGSFLDREKEIQQKYTHSLERLANEQMQVDALVQKIDYYKSSIAERKIVSEKADFVADRMNENLYLNHVTIDPTQFKLSLTGKNIYGFTQFIVYLLSDKYVSEVSIISANYDPTEEQFTVELSGVFK